MSFRTSPPMDYITPGVEEMKDMARKVGLKAYSKELVSDLANLAAGGKINPRSSYMSQIRDNIKVTEKREGSETFYADSSNQPHRSFREAYEASEKKAIRYHQNVSDFLAGADMHKYPGDSPLAKAMNLLKLLSKKSGGSSGGSDGETLPIFTDNGQSEKVAEDLNQVMDDVESLSSDEKDLLDPESDKSDGSSDKEAKGDDGLQKMKIAEDMIEGKNIILEISRKLDKLTKLQVRKSKKQFSDPNGEDIINRPMKDLSELGKIRSSDWVEYSVNRNLFLYKAVTGSLMVRERVMKLEKKQLLYIIIDCSGSMKSGQRLSKAFGILMNRLKAVMAGDCELYARLFDTQLYKEQFASTPAEAKQLFQDFTQKNYSGGSTDISGCVVKAHQRIVEILEQNRSTLYRPELVVITDGADEIKFNNKSIEGTILHSFVVENKNQPLLDVAVKSGGVGLYL